MVSELWYLEKDYRLIPHSPGLQHPPWQAVAEKKDRGWQSQGDLCSNLKSTIEYATWASYLTSPNLSFLVSELPTGRVDVKARGKSFMVLSHGTCSIRVAVVPILILPDPHCPHDSATFSWQRQNQ